MRLSSGKKIASLTKLTRVSMGIRGLDTCPHKPRWLTIPLRQVDEFTGTSGSVDQKTQRAAWTIGKKNDRVFDAGIFNLIKAETPVLVHLGFDNPQQWMLVRVEEPKSGASSD